MTLEQFFEDYDWREAFSIIEPADNPTTREVRTFKMSDIAEIISTSNGYNDGDSWIGLFLTKDGVYLYLDAWCDNTGWDCRAGASAEWHTDLEQAKAMIPEKSRNRLFPEAA